MSFQEFDLSDYITALEDFKNNSTDDAIKHRKRNEKYTESMKHNLEHFSELTEIQLTGEVKEIGKQSDISI